MTVQLLRLYSGFVRVHREGTGNDSLRGVSGVDVDLDMHTERTPNPDSVKWVLGAPLVDRGQPVSLEVETSPEVSPLGARLLALEGVASILLASNSITVCRESGMEWPVLGEAVSRVIQEWQSSGEAVLGPAFQVSQSGKSDQVILRIEEVLNDEIRPYVEQDGGAVSFEGFDAGIVRVRLRGACETCPNAAMTLKLSIEARLCEEVPEVEAVEAI